MDKENKNAWYKKAGPNLDKTSVWLLDPASFMKIIQSFILMRNTKKWVQTGGGKICGTFFSEKVPFLANIGCWPNFLG